MSGRPTAPMRKVTTKITYLEMLRPYAAEAKPPVDGLSIEHLEAPSADEYRALYRSVGRDYHWADRLLMPDDQLRAILQDDAVEIHLLRVGGQPAGYSELDRRTAGQIELAYFGLFPEFTGRGLGRYFLAWTLQKAWSYRPKRVWVHTCDLDHPAALPMYLKTGFRIYHEKTAEQVVLDDY